MSYSHAIRITLPYEDCKTIISEWADRCTAAVVYQHDADEEISKTHVHIGLQGCDVKPEALKRMWKDAPGKGNEFWSWKDWDDADKYLTYMSKGTLCAKFVKNISEDRLEKSRQDWVEPVKADKPGDSSERIISKILAKFDNYNDKIDYGDYQDFIGIETVFHKVRSETFRQLWGEHRKVPHATHYKQIAGTVFLRLCERLDRFEEGMGQIQNLWY